MNEATTATCAATRWPALGWCLATALLAGCATPSGAPSRGAASPAASLVASLPGRYAQAGAPGDAAADRAPLWWRDFGDVELDRLVDEALKRNNNLAAAALRARQAQLRAGLAQDRQAPQLSGSVSAGIRSPLDADGPASLRTTRSSGAALAASYELDLWGKLSAQRDVAEWEARASAQDRASAALVLVGTTARLYWQIGFVNQRLAVTAQSVVYAQTTLDLVLAQHRAGAVSGLEVAEARQALSSQQSSQSQLLQQAVEAATALALLFDSPPGTPWTQANSLASAALPKIEPGVPAELLARRPDLRAAELRLRQLLSSIDATRASYYPSFSLTGSLGTSSAALLNALQNPVAALSLGVGLPFLQQTQMKLNIQVSEAQYQEALLNFRQTLYTALGDVDNALSAGQQLARQAGLLEQALADARTAERLYELRYRAGATALKSWLDAQEKRRTAEVALASNRLARLNNQMSLYLALGGNSAAS
jgi:NodT family efflux transporter outer membrane factor (OMF) lipoprotein